MRHRLRLWVLSDGVCLVVRDTLDANGREAICYCELDYRFIVSGRAKNDHFA